MVVVPSGTRPVTSAEVQLLRLAVDLGGLECGGPLSPDEQRLAALARQEPPSGEPELEAARRQIAAGADPLGERLSRIRSGAQRRALGAFYTPPALVEPMVEWVLAQGVNQVIDPGCGSGRFAAAVVRRKPEMAVVALDIDPLATILARSVLGILRARNATVLQADYTAFETLRLPRGEGRTGFVGNPPYVRHHDLTQQAKERAEAMARRLGHSFSGLAGLHAHFYLATGVYAEPGDVGCFVTSSEWLDIGYGSVIRDLLLNSLGGEALHVIEPTAVPFEAAMVTAAIACFRVGHKSKMLRVRLVETLHGVADLNLGRDVEHAMLAAARRWTPFLNGRSAGPADSSTVPLRAFARVHRGVATGANSFFVLAREEARLLGLEPWCRPAITSAAEILESGGVVRDGPLRKLLLDLPGDVERRAHPELDAYLKWGERPRDGRPRVADGYLARHRQPWWRIGVPPAAPIVVSYMARRPPVFALNPDGLVLANVAHGLYPVKELDDEQLAALVDYLNGARNSFRGRGRTYHGGLEKFEPRELEALPVPADGPWA